MERETLVFGLALSLAGFAAKTGLGWAYALSGRGPVGRVAVSAGLLAVYGAAFAGLYMAALRLNMQRFYDIGAPLWRHGVLLHWLLAGLLFLWALALLRRPEESSPAGSRGWLALALPCPVCLGLVFLSTAALTLYFPDEAPWAVLGLYGLFVGTALAGAALYAAGPGRGVRRREDGLGTAMLLTALYFALFARAAPQFADIDRVYRLAGQARTENAAPTASVVGAALAVLALAGAGFWNARRKWGRSA
jgi:predicted transporter